MTTHGSTGGLRSTVLVVDDTPDTLGLLTDALEGAGYTTLVATGGERALALVDRLTPDMILLDAVMPGLDGFDTCRRLKAGAAAHVPVIFMTALSDTAHIVRGFEAGGTDYVTKPIVLDELLARMRVHLDQARTAHSARLALDSAGSTLVALDRTGAVVWSTPQAASLLGSAREGRPGMPSDLLPALLAAAATATPEPVVLKGPAGGQDLRLAYLGASAPGEMLFRLSRDDARAETETLRAKFALTPREAEVLLWLARGKPNRDIAEILDLSPRTVNKHLETVYSKLGVENRASAAVLASRALGER